MKTNKRYLTKTACCLLLAALVVLFAAPNAKAEPDQAGWEYHFAPYLWAIGIDADTTVKGVDASVDMDFGDIVDKMDMGFIGYLEARRKPWSLYVDYTYLDVSDSGHTRISKIDYNSQSSVLEFGCAYEVASSQPTEDGDQLALDVLAGGRAMMMKSEIKFPRLGDFSERQDWIDPIIGARARLLFGKGFFVNARADIGGFGISSELTYKLEAILGYQFFKGVSAFVGVRDLYDDYEDGEGRDKFAFKGHIYGPMIGMLFSF